MRCWRRPPLFKRSKLGDQLKGRSIALVFFNPSLRTRTSFELGAFQLGGHAVVLQPGKDAWPIEFDLGTVMDGDTEEHIAEVAQGAVALCRPDRRARLPEVRRLVSGSRGQRAARLRASIRRCR